MFDVTQTFEREAEAENIFSRANELTSVFEFELACPQALPSTNDHVQHEVENICNSRVFHTTKNEQVYEVEMIDPCSVIDLTNLVAIENCPETNFCNSLLNVRSRESHCIDDIQLLEHERNRMHTHGELLILAGGQMERLPTP